MKRSQWRWLLGAIAFGVIILITLLAAPANTKLNSGSTYSRNPEGYGAWYAFMSERGTPVQRWQRPFEDLVKRQDAKRPVTLLRVYSTFTEAPLSKVERDWLEQGNTLIILGLHRPVTEAPFSTTPQLEARSIKIDTQRRHQKTQEQRILLGDRFGAIVWEASFGKGNIIFTTTPHLAANAYQDFPDNYEFLVQLVTQRNQPIWVDEYIHGYKDSDVRDRKAGQTVFSYLAQTPLLPIFIQGLILLLVAIWAGNRRFGKSLALSAPVVNNSEAYIEALAGVLQKADSCEFVLDIVGKEEQLQLQKALFLGQVPLDNQALIDAWVQQTGHSARQLEQLLLISSQKRRMSETDLLTWLDNWEQIRRHLPSYRRD